MLPLARDQFADFFRAVHGSQPFEWQRRFAEEVFEQGFHDVIRVPTGCGKTSALDVAVFDLALQVEREPQERTSARRICFVVDRRLVVDQVTEHAWQIRSAVLQAARGKRKEPALMAVAERLASLAVKPKEPLRVVRLRGGVYRDDGWSADPLTPSILVSTVDQIGSRLLFRGYGVSRRSRPPQAGLLAFDTRIILDEAHLSSVFAETVAHVRRFEEWAERAPISLRRRVSLVQMSATATRRDRTFELNEAERKDEQLTSRLEARKPAELIEVLVEPITKEKRKNQPIRAREQEKQNRESLVREIVKHAKGLAGVGDQSDDENRPRTIGVVVNRVSTARLVFEQLRRAVEGECDRDAILLTGRVRPYDRDRLLEQWLPSIKAGREPGRDCPLFVVATQTVEVGANLDFDGLITEIASLDALRQRFGRLDRLGTRHERNWPSPACILTRSDQKSNSDNDPVYGPAIAQTWKWLKSKATTRGTGASKQSIIDFGIEQVEPMLPNEPDELRPMLAPRPDAPILLPAHLDAWVQTSPVPVSDPDVAPFLHGRLDEAADVQVVWRGDLNGENERFWAGIICLMPPRTREALSLPVYEVRAWLHDQAEADVADVEGVAIDQALYERGRRRRALRWRGPRDAQPVDPDAIRPGDTIVVPASYGGADAFGWNPTSRASVPDIAESCLAEVIASYPADAFRCPKLRFRLHPDLLPLPNDAARPSLRAQFDVTLRAALEDEQDSWPPVRRMLEHLLDHLAAPSHRAAAEAILNATRPPRMDPYPDDSGVVLSGALSVYLDEARVATVESEYEEPEDDASSFASDEGAVPLVTHSHDVGTLAERFAGELDLPGDIAAAVREAGLWHDEGKRDVRFQAQLHGSELKAFLALAENRPLAKSVRDPTLQTGSPAFGYPRGARHEFVSVRIWQQAATVSGGNAELTRYLIGIHHGYGRPFPPIVQDPIPVDVTLHQDGKRIAVSSDHTLYRLDSGWVDLFWRMVRRYGWWGIAYLEALLVTADRSVSARTKPELRRSNRLWRPTRDDAPAT